MKVQEVKEYVELHIPYKYVVNMFHSQTPDNVCMVQLASSGIKDTNIGAYQFQFLIRNNDPEQAEAVAFMIFDHFNNRTDYMVGTDRVIMSRGQQSVPLYTGTDENNRYIYSVNIVASVDV